MRNFCRCYLVFVIKSLAIFMAIATYAQGSVERLAGQYIVVLDTPTISAPSDQLQLATQSVSALARQQVHHQQQVFSRQVKRQVPGARIKRRFDTLINAVEVAIDDSQLPALLALPAVKQIYPVRMRYAHLDASHQVTGSVQGWQLLGGQQHAGKGVKIAIIDSGIQPRNPMFSDNGLDAPDLARHSWLQETPDYCRQVGGDPNFCNNKVIIARVFPPSEDDIFHLEPGVEISPLDNNRHGSHVAGIAAGVPIDVTFEDVNVSLSGVAPGAYLMVYKALFDNGGVVRGSDAMLLQALEYAVKDGADVINNSWGAIQDEDPQASVFAAVFAAAEQMGIVIVNSAGNNGAWGDNAINCPGCIESGITVANSTHGRTFGHKITLGDTQIASSSGDNQLAFEDLQLPLMSARNLSSDACNSISTAVFSGAAVLIDYNNGCPLDTLAHNVAQAGGQALLIYQENLSDFETLRPFNQISGDFPVPVLGLTREQGRMLQERALTPISVTISGSREALVDQSLHNQLNPGSSVGPNTNPNVLKPDITAPGTDILSAAAPRPDVIFPPGLPPISDPDNEQPVFALISGTSMSSPQVAGAAALLRQAHPDWSAAQIKTALTSTASASIKKEQATATPFEQGAGLLNIAAAIEATLTFTSASHAHGACVARCHFANQLTNVSDQNQSVQVSIQLDHPLASYTLAQPYFDLSAAGSSGSSANLSFSIDTSAVENATWVFGRVMLTLSNGKIQQLPIAVYANDNSDTRALSSNISLGPDGQLNATTRVRNVDFVSPPSLSISTPDFATILADSIRADTSNGQTNELAINSDGKLLWRGTLSAGNMQLQPTTAWSAPSLKASGVPPVACQDSCFAFSKQVDFPFIYHGQQYQGITVSSNGFIVAGQVELGPFDANPVMTLPSEDNLNNVIAPLWAEYDLRNPGTPDDSGQGELYIDTVSWQGEEYLVVEWNQVGLFGYDEEGYEPYTFQVIIKANSDQILFNYLHVTQLVNAIIGAENHDATLGVTYSPQTNGLALPIPIQGSNVSLALTSQPAGMADIHYAIALQAAGIQAQADEIRIEEDQSVSIDVLKNDNPPRDLVISAELTGTKQRTEAQRLVSLPLPPLDASTLSIVSAPLQGSAAVVEGRINYTPDPNFNGNDTLTYQVADQTGKLSTATQVTLIVSAVNDAPSIDSIATQLVAPGTDVSVIAQGSDAENDSLTWTWTQTAGPAVSMTTDANQLQFRAPNSPAGASLSFSVTASDGLLSSTPQQAKVTVRATEKAADNRSGGSLHYALLYLLILLMVRKRSLPQ